LLCNREIPVALGTKHRLKSLKNQNAPTGICYLKNYQGVYPGTSRKREKGREGGLTAREGGKGMDGEVKGGNERKKKWSGKEWHS
jgi:hypothetical protein